MASEGQGSGSGSSASATTTSKATKKYRLTDKADLTDLTIKGERKSDTIVMTPGDEDPTELTDEQYQRVKDLPGVNLTEVD